MATGFSELLTPAEAAEILSIGEQTLAVWRVTGRYDLPYVKVGRAVRYSRDDLAEFVQRRTATSTSEAIR